MSDFARFFRTREEAQAEAARMRASGWPSAKVVKHDIGAYPISAEDANYYGITDQEVAAAAADTGERWLITVGGGGYLLDSGRVDRQPSA